MFMIQYLFTVRQCSSSLSGLDNTSICELHFTWVRLITQIRHDCVFKITSLQAKANVCIPLSTHIWLWVYRLSLYANIVRSSLLYHTLTLITCLYVAGSISKHYDEINNRYRFFSLFQMISSFLWPIKYMQEKLSRVKIRHRSIMKRILHSSVVMLWEAFYVHHSRIHFAPGHWRGPI